MATASAGRADKDSGRRAASLVSAAPPRRPCSATASRPAEGIWARKRRKRANARLPTRQPRSGARMMTKYDPEIEHLRQKVHCAAVLERQSSPWRLDRTESTKHCLKYRRPEAFHPCS
jgi:hypothetical protein